MPEIQANAINTVLICKICENKMMDPRILPCVSTMRGYNSGHRQKEHQV
jgi:hypothetical protein